MLEPDTSALKGGACVWFVPECLSIVPAQSVPGESASRCVYSRHDWRLASTVSLARSPARVAGSQSECLYVADAFSISRNDSLWEPHAFPYETTASPWSSPQPPGSGYRHPPPTMFVTVEGSGSATSTSRQTSR